MALSAEGGLMTLSDRQLAEIEYPTSDGEPMGETDVHRDLMIDLIESIRAYYADNPDVYVSGNILLLYDQQDPKAHYSPDVLVTLGISNERRENYKLWEIGKAPDLVIEVTSKSTRLRDIGIKKGLYEAIGVKEYLLFDPRKEYLQPRFQVYRNDGSGFLPVLVPDAGYQSTSLGLIFREVDGQLRVFDPVSGQALRTPREQARRAERLAEKLRQLGVDPDEV